MSICILTDTSAQFSHPHFPGKEFVHVLPVEIFNEEETAIGIEQLKQGALPGSLAKHETPQVSLPTEEEIRRTFDHLGGRFDEILVLLPTVHVGDLLPRARAAAKNARNRDSILIIDTLTVSIGLGMLVEAAAEYVEKGISLQDIKTNLLGLMEHIYCIICLDGLTYLSHSGFITRSQALIGEMLDVRPLYMLEKGQLVPIQKVRNSRHLVECLYEFIGEFAGVEHIAIVQGVPPYEPEARALRDRISEDLPGTPISEHIISAPLAAVFGPHSIGIFVREPNEFDEDIAGDG